METRLGKPEDTLSLRLGKDNQNNRDMQEGFIINRQKKRKFPKSASVCQHYFVILQPT